MNLNNYENQRKRYPINPSWEEQNPSYLFNEKVLIELQETIEQIKKKEQVVRIRKEEKYYV